MMSVYLVSYYAHGGRYASVYDSIVRELPTQSLSMQAMMDFRQTLGMEKGMDVSLIGWDPLPDRDEHPAVGSPYGYYVTFAIVDPYGDVVIENTMLASALPILTEQDVRDAEQDLRNGRKDVYIRIIGCKPMCTLTNKLADDYGQVG